MPSHLQMPGGGVSLLTRAHLWPHTPIDQCMGNATRGQRRPHHRILSGLPKYLQQYLTKYLSVCGKVHDATVAVQACLEE